MSATTWIALVVALILLIVILAMRRKEKGTKFHYDVANMTFDALLIAIVVLLAFTQIGYITVLPGITFTLIHIPVLLGAYVGGRRKGLLLGTVFGVTSMLVSMTSPSGLNALFIFPYNSIPSRMIFGYLAGLFFELYRKKADSNAKKALLPLWCFLLTVLHTVLVFGFLFIFSYGDVISFFASGTEVAEGIIIAFAGLIAIGMAGEGILAGIIVPALGALLYKTLPGYARKLEGKSNA